MQIHCKSCGREIDANDINLDRAIAKCRECNAVFSFSDRIPGSVRPVSRRDPVPMPRAINIERMGGGRTIVRRWYSPVLFFLVVFIIIWDGFLVFWYVTALSSDDAPLMMKIFPLGHVAVGLGLTYYTLAGFLNRTRIHADRGEVSIRHGPLPWFGNRTIRAVDLEQLYCTRHVSRSRNSRTVTFRVNAATRGGRKIKLLSGIAEEDQALFIEQELEQHLNIEDREVRGEIRK
jgi:hypothetical protein